MNIFFFHANIIKFQNRPFATVEEMNETLIKNHNFVVKSDDEVYHIGDFSLGTSTQTSEIIAQLSGTHYFLPGSHDYWMAEENFNAESIKSKNGKSITILPYIYNFPYSLESGEQKYIVLCHYAMRVWPRSHYNSYLFYGHSHGHLPNYGLSRDVGVDVTNFYPIWLENAIQLTDMEHSSRKEF